MNARNGAGIVCQELESLGVKCVFGLPGTQNIELFEALRRSSLRTVVTTSELTAAFMATGYARASGQSAVLTTIPGPGFAYAVPGLAEAFFDSVPLLHIVPKPVSAGSSPAVRRSLDPKALAHSIVKSVNEVEQVSELSNTLREAYHSSLSGEPGPVLVEVAGHVLAGSACCRAVRRAPPDACTRVALPRPEDTLQVLGKILSSRRVVLYCGQGANTAAQAVRELAELLEAPVVTTRSGRGLLPEDHRLSIVFNSDRGSVKGANRLFERSDLVLALGCKAAHDSPNGSGFRIRTEKLIHVDASPDVLERDSNATTKILGRVEHFVGGILRHRELLQDRRCAWGPDEIRELRRAIPAEAANALLEPGFSDLATPTAAAFFAALREAMPRDGVLVTDSGRHQVMARVHFRALAPRSFIVPGNFQSMGFGLPAAIGAKLADPQRPVVALIGDGGFAMSAMELITAVRYETPLTVIVFNDGALGQIRLEQVTANGVEHGTSLSNPDFERFASALGIKYLRLAGDPVDVLRTAVCGNGVSLVEVKLREGSALGVRRAEALARKTARRVLGGRLARELKNRVVPR